MELDELDRAGIKVERDEEAFSVGVVQLHLSMEIDGKEQPLIVTFPDLYPYFRFDIQAPTLNLDHHQHPRGNNLCLLGRGTEHWHTNLTVAQMIEEQLPVVFRAGASHDLAEVRTLEQNQAEPFSDYYPYPPSTMVMLESNWTIPADCEGGRLRIGMDKLYRDQTEPLLRGTVLEVRSDTNQLLAQTDPVLHPLYNEKTIEGVWVRSAKPIEEFEADKFVKRLIDEYPLARMVQAQRFKDGWLMVWGVLFPEEIGHRAMGQGWVFVCAHDRDQHKLMQILQAPGNQSYQPYRGHKKSRGKRR